MSDEDKPADTQEQDSTSKPPTPPKPDAPDNIEFRGGDVPTLKTKKKLGL